MNRRAFLTAIPAAVAALTGVKASQAASPVVGQSEAITDVWMGEIGSDVEVPIYSDVHGMYAVPAGTYIDPGVHFHGTHTLTVDIVDGLWDRGKLIESAEGW